MKGDVKGAADLFNILYDRFPRIRPYIEERIERAGRPLKFTGKG
jgi:hypothetical protein